MPDASAPLPPTRPPSWLWLLFAAVAVLRTLPWLATYAIEPGEGSQLLHVGFIPKDLLQYIAFARESAASGSLFVANPFTTEPQDGRFLLPLIALAGFAHAAIGGEIATWIELSRIPLVFAWLAALWRLAALFVPDACERALACALVACSGGLEVLAPGAAFALSDEMRTEIAQATWQMNGWTSFALAYNPLWLAGSALSMTLLAFALAPGERAAMRSAALFAAGSFALYAIHPYSSVALFVVLAAHAAVELALRSRGEREACGGAARVGLLATPVRTGALLGAGAIAVLATWQRADAAFAASARAALGSQQLSPFWYPLVFGGLFVLALRGARDWLAGEHALRFALLGWVVAAVWLHTSSLLNGYHFASQLHVPLCFVAAPAFARTWRDARAGRAGAIALCLLTLGGPLLYTADALVALREQNRVPVEYPAIAEALAELPPGNALTGAKLGNYLPAFAPHRVYVGHHFLTPDYRERAERVADWTTSSTAEAGRALDELVCAEQIRYAVLPSARASAGIAALAPRTTRARRIGRYSLLELDCPSRERGAGAGSL